MYIVIRTITKDTVDIDSPSAGTKRPISTVLSESDHQNGNASQSSSTLFTGSNAHTTLSLATGNDIISDLYMNDDVDTFNFTLATLCPNEMKLCSHMIGKQGANIADIKNKTGIRVQLESNCTFPERGVFYMGTCLV